MLYKNVLLIYTEMLYYCKISLLKTINYKHLIREIYILKFLSNCIHRRN